MVESERLRNQIGELAAAVFDGSIDQPQFDRLKALLEDQPEAQKIYAELVGLHVGLQDVCGVQPLGDCFGYGSLNLSDADEIDKSTDSTISPNLTDLDSKDDPFGIGDTTTRWIGPLSFPRGFYKIAMPGVVVVLLLVVAINFGWLRSWNDDRAIARVIRQSIDTHWSNTNGKKVANPNIESLDWCELNRGMVQIEFRKGATALVEGPAQFRVLNENSLQMKSGKISASVPDPAHGFTVLAPNVKVVDLGTEFGVDASRLDETSVQVTSGRVAVTTFDPDGFELEQKELIEEQCFTVSRAGNLEEVRFGSVKFPVKLSDASIDLVDLVCGGSGNNQKRGYAIDCHNGQWQKLTEPFTGKIPKNALQKSSGYHLVPELPFVDGVFVPNNQRGPMRVDSFGHQFIGFGKTSGYSYDRLMAGADLEFYLTPRFPQRLMVDGVDFTKLPQGLLVLRGNKGITFDLEKIRNANPGMKITKFRSLAANTEKSTELKLVDGPFRADLWVIVDGVAAYVRTGLSSREGTLDIDIPIPENAHFLTLAATEGQKYSIHDWIVFANPTLELMEEK